ncbi:hypothetical protein EGR_05894 [Echinococcus granulosus]|uniref:Uncharacterized protein n=1 Tax=Echinococcus granulosus TaxID=6210 RepID=W6UE18_ECHGR|nr:hypothetical protein EGR_05894 [Echinococcus granulosus]EUB59293.1 hypothetical protein EGR_05894 [Echinococcus granulosus]
MYVSAVFVDFKIRPAAVKKGEIAVCSTSSQAAAVAATTTGTTKTTIPIQWQQKKGGGDRKFYLNHQACYFYLYCLCHYHHENGIAADFSLIPSFPSSSLK